MLKTDSKQPRRLCTGDFLPRDGKMPKYLPFFATKPGEFNLKPSDAQALVELARAANIEIKETLAGMHFYNVDKRIQGEEAFMTWSKGEASTSAMTQALSALTDNHRLIAWLMESLNTLKKMREAVANVDTWYYLESIKGLSSKEIEELQFPDEEYHDEPSLVKEYLDTLSVESLSEYLFAEAEASVYGKTLSEKGEVNELYKQYLRAVSHPTIFDKPNECYGNQSLVVTTFSLTVPKEEMTATYDSIMKHYLELQKVVKSHQGRMSAWIEKRKIEIANEEKERLLKVRATEQELKVWKMTQINALSDLFIVIPANLQAAYARLSAKRSTTN